MSIKKIGSDILRKKTAKVTAFDDLLKALVAQMTVDMHKARGIGLAANQIGIDMSVCIVKINPHSSTPPKVFVNPEIVSAELPIDFEEGCLSIPGVAGKTKRCTLVKVKYQDIDGKLIEEDLHGMEAIAIQHEVDHLNGKLYIDIMDAQDRDRLMSTYKKLGE